MKDQPKEMTICNLEVLVMPQGEVICNGKTVGWFRDLGTFLSVKKKDDEK